MLNYIHHFSIVSNSHSKREINNKFMLATGSLAIFLLTDLFFLQQLMIIFNYSPHTT